MSKEIKNINIAFPCQENLKAASIAEGDFLCLRCNSKVYDFRNKSKLELDSLKLSSETLICGKFKKSQLSETFLKAIATSAIIFGLGVSNQAFSQDKIPAGQEEKSNNDDVFLGTLVDRIPEPVNGFKSLWKAISKEIPPPDSLTENVRFFLSFFVETSGNLSDVRIIRGHSPEIDKYVLERFKHMNPKFTPAVQGNKNVRIKYTLPISLNPKNENE